MLSPFHVIIIPPFSFLGLVGFVGVYRRLFCVRRSWVLSFFSFFFFFSYSPESTQLTTYSSNPPTNVWVSVSV